MGYEVLDAEDGATTPSGARQPRPAAHVVALESLPPPPDGEPGQGTRWRRSAARSGAHPSRRLLALAVVAALALGAVAGVAWSGHHDQQVRSAEHRAERQAALAVTAMADSYTLSTASRRPTIDVVVRLFNNGPLPLDVVGSPDGARATTTAAVVHGFAGTLRLTNRHPLALSLSLALDCTSTQQLHLYVPVRTADGRLHDVRVHNRPTQRLVPADICRNDYSRSVGAQLAGTLERPFIELQNPMDRPVTVHLDPGSPFTQASSEVVNVHTDPKLPVVVPAHGSRRLALTVTAGTCTRDLQTVQGRGLGNITLQAETAGATPGGTTSVPLGLDLTALVGAALERACD